MYCAPMSCRTFFPSSLPLCKTIDRSNMFIMKFFDYMKRLRTFKVGSYLLYRVCARRPAASRDCSTRERLRLLRRTKERHRTLNNVPYGNLRFQGFSSFFEVYLPCSVLLDLTYCDPLLPVIFGRTTMAYGSFRFVHMINVVSRGEDEVLRTCYA